jgi:hypothetical protein
MSVVAWNDDAFPQALRTIGDCPPALWYRGSLDALHHAPCIIRRLRQHFGSEVRIMVGMWTAKSSEARGELIETTGADLVATSLRQAVRQVRDGVQPEPAEATPPAA